MTIHEITIGKHSIEYDTEAFRGKWRKEILKIKRKANAKKTRIETDTQKAR